MGSNERGELIEVWRPHDLTQLELRRGVADTQPVPRHWHEEYQLCLIQSGKGELSYRGTNFCVPPASLFMIHPGEVHSNYPDQSFGASYRMILVDAELMRCTAAELHRKESGLPFFPAAVLFDREAIRRYLDLYFALERPASTLERQSLLLNLLTTLIVRFAEHRPAPRQCGLERQAVSRACDYLAEHYAENVTLEDLAQIANLSRFHFNRVFSEQMGMPPHAFQTQLRVLRAKTLLRQGWSIPQVAALTGFFDQSHLNRHFKRLVVVTPGQYRMISKNVQDRPQPALLSYSS
jgi:AraC-like DNA-binding protein